MTGLLILLIAGFAIIVWWRLLNGKELARRAAALTCREHGLVLMDDTVILDSVQLRREDPVRAWGLKYTFDFARNGVLRKGGIVLIAPGRQPTVIIETDNGQIIERLK
ncbi:MAG: DUF3301 domain-containing protein [Gammaproteobacteria bacterium]|jgi:hypothetical protein|nr:DUF3301 domain-containing protein [Gammaproteobacteria bacterium]